METTKEGNFEILKFESKNHYCIDGFANNNKKWMVVLPSPMRNQHVFMGIKSSVIILPDNIDKPRQILNLKKEEELDIWDISPPQNKFDSCKDERKDNLQYRREIYGEHKLKEYKREVYSSISSFDYPKRAEEYEPPYKNYYRRTFLSIMPAVQKNSLKSNIFENEQKKCEKSPLLNSHKKLRIRQPYYSTESSLKYNSDIVRNIECI